MKINQLKAKISSLQLVKSVAALVQSFKNGSCYETMNPHCRPEVKAAEELLVEITGVSDILAVDCEAIIAQTEADLALESTYVAVECPSCHAELHNGASAYALIPGVIANNDDCFICGGDPEDTIVICEECGERAADMIAAGLPAAISASAMIRVLEEVQSSADNTGCEDCYVISAKAFNAVVDMLKMAKGGDELVLYTIAHEHRHGTDTHLVKCGHFPTTGEVIKACDIDFERDDENPREFLTIDPASDVVSIPPTTIVEVHVKQLVEDEELDSEDKEAEIKGIYEVSVPFGIDPAVASSIALDAFHEETPISCPEHFEISCTIDGAAVEESDDEGYSRKGEALSAVWKISDNE